MKRYRRTRLTKSQQTPPDLFKDHLRPLTQGRSVSLVVTVPKQNGKQVREQKYLALLAPSNLYGMRHDLILVSVIGKGSCILDLTQMKGVGELTKAGVPTRLAASLLKTLKELFGE